MMRDFVMVPTEEGGLNNVNFGARLQPCGNLFAAKLPVLPGGGSPDCMLRLCACLAGIAHTDGGMLYANTRFFIPWGWYSNAISSLCSTGWSVMEEEVRDSTCTTVVVALLPSSV